MMKIKYILLLLVALIFAVACDTNIEAIDKQREGVVSFLTKKHDPILIPASKVEESLEAEPEFYTTSGNTAFRYIVDYYNPQRETQKEVKRGDAIYLTFWCYDFSSFSTPSDRTLYYTNDPAYEDAFVNAGLDIKEWSFEPEKIVLGSGAILKQIEESLVGCREGDSVEIYLTYNVAYGDKWIGVTSKEAPLAFFCKIESIEN